MTTAANSAPYVTISNAGKVYPSPRGDVTALSDINLDIRTGEFLSIVGPSGCGKSTLLKCVAGLENISSGNISVYGKTVDGPPDKLGVVFQRDVLLDWRTILDNVLLSAEFLGHKRAHVKDRAVELLQRFGLGGFEDRHPWELSGGMRQRASICRALLSNPELLLMDEPFGALDAMTRERLQDELLDIWQRTKLTVVFVTHSIEEAIFLADRVVVMTPGPGRIESDNRLDLPRPRDVASPEFNTIRRALGAKLHSHHSKKAA